MKNKIVATLALSLLVTAQAAPTATMGRHEAFCTALATLAEYTALGRANGRSEKQAKALATGSAGAAAIEPSSLKVVEYVYASQLGPQDARKVVFVNCLNRNFN